MIHGTVLSWQQSEKFGSGWISDDSNNWYYARATEVEVDSTGKIMLVVGEPVTIGGVESGVNKKGKKFRDALDIQRPWKDVTTDPATHREACKYLNSNWVLREIGGLAAIAFGEEHFRRGNIVECSFEPSFPPFKTWRAHNLVLLATDEESWLATLET